MQNLKELIHMKTNSKVSATYRRKTEAEIMNELEGHLTGYDCRICRNKGVVYTEAENGETVFFKCGCWEKRKSLAKIKASGLKDLLDSYTFDKFECSEVFQLKIKEKALHFVKDENKRGFFIGGQVGCGKSHICTAIVREFLVEQGIETLYMQWRGDSTRLKAITNTEEYTHEVEKYKTVPVLYIDDLFKTASDKTPTTADINLAFEIINHRYINKDLITVISTEKLPGELIDIDEAVASRILEMCMGYVLPIEYKKGRNFRLKSTAYI